jgi:hypothetical protein
MARRRMIDPDFWTDPEVNQCSYPGKILILGCMSNADDEGRIQAHPSLLKSRIFIYDDDQTPGTIQALLKEILEKMKMWHPNNQWLMRSYENAGTEYIYFPNWHDTQKPSHPTPSRLPAPSLGSGEAPEIHPNISRASQEDVERHSALGQSSLGQSSLGKVSIGKVSPGKDIEEDFTNVNGKDMTDFLTLTLEKYRPRGPAWLTEVLCKFWLQSIGEPMKQEVFARTTDAVKTYSPAVLARAYVKTVNYRGGKFGSWKYLDKVLNEKAEEGKNSGRRPPN